MKKIDISKIRGKWIEYDAKSKSPAAGGDDSIESIRMVAEKVNELIDHIEPSKESEGAISQSWGNGVAYSDHQEEESSWEKEYWALCKKVGLHLGYAQKDKLDAVLAFIHTQISKVERAKEEEFDRLLITSMPSDAENLSLLTPNQAAQTIKNLLKKLSAHTNQKKGVC